MDSKQSVSAAPTHLLDGRVQGTSYCISFMQEAQLSNAKPSIAKPSCKQGDGAYSPTSSQSQRSYKFDMRGLQKRLHHHPSESRMEYVAT